jgi:hypothetical protein
MEGLLLEALAAEKIRDTERRAAQRRRSRRPGSAPKRPAGSWVLSGTIATWLGR